MAGSNLDCVPKYHHIGFVNVNGILTGERTITLFIKSKLGNTLTQNKTIEHIFFNFL